MASANTNRAVALYRKRIKAERKLDAMSDELGRRVTGLTEDEFRDYASMTIAIDEAINAVDEGSEQAVIAAINSAGLDRS
jgi:hypothetical protein